MVIYLFFVSASTILNHDFVKVWIAKTFHSFCWHLLGPPVKRRLLTPPPNSEVDDFVDE